MLAEIESISCGMYAAAARLVLQEPFRNLLLLVTVHSSFFPAWISRTGCRPSYNRYVVGRDKPCLWSVLIMRIVQRAGSNLSRCRCRFGNVFVLEAKDGHL